MLGLGIGMWEPKLPLSSGLLEKLHFGSAAYKKRDLMYLL